MGKTAIFKINGLAVSEIYVDGVKLSNHSELDNIPGEMIDKVQVQYLAGADQNAAISGGTIRITLRRPPGRRILWQFYCKCRLVPFMRFRQ